MPASFRDLTNSKLKKCDFGDFYLDFQKESFLGNLQKKEFLLTNLSKCDCIQFFSFKSIKIKNKYLV